MVLKKNDPYVKNILGFSKLGLAKLQNTYKNDKTICITLQYFITMINES